MATVRLRSPLRELAGGNGAVQVEGSTVGAVLDELQREHPRLSGWILDERGTVREHVNVFLNGEKVGLAASVGPTDRIEVLGAISGGSGGVARPERGGDGRD